MLVRIDDNLIIDRVIAKLHNRITRELTTTIKNRVAKVLLNINIEKKIEWTLNKYIKEIYDKGFKDGYDKKK